MGDVMPADQPRAIRYARGGRAWCHTYRAAQIADYERTGPVGPLATDDQLRTLREALKR